MTTPSKTLLVKWVKAKKNAGYNDYVNLATEEDVTAGFTAKIVDTLPTVGDPKYMYLVPKEGSTDDTYDEYIWALQADNTYGWEHVGSTAVTIEVDDHLSDTSENPVQNKVITAALGNIETILHQLNNGEES